MDCCAKKRVRIITACLVFTLLCTSCFCLELGQRIEKVINLNGKNRSVFVKVRAIAEYEYDSNGKILHSRTKDPFGMFEEQYKYDSNGNEIWHGYGYRYKEWKDYNSLNQNIHGKDSDGNEWENEFDSRGELVLRRYLSGSNVGIEHQYFYSRDGKLIGEHEVHPENYIPAGLRYVIKYRYDEKGNRISSHMYDTHPSFFTDREKNFIYERFWEYDEKGHEVAWFVDAKAKNKGIPTEIYEYEFWTNGNIKTKITYDDIILIQRY